MPLVIIGQGGQGRIVGHNFGELTPFAGAMIRALLTEMANNKNSDRLQEKEQNQKQQFRKSKGKIMPPCYFTLQKAPTIKWTDTTEQPLKGQQKYLKSLDVDLAAVADIVHNFFNPQPFLKSNNNNYNHKSFHWLGLCWTKRRPLKSSDSNYPKFDSRPIQSFCYNHIQKLFSLFLSQTVLIKLVSPQSAQAIFFLRKNSNAAPSLGTCLRTHY